MNNNDFRLSIWIFNSIEMYKYYDTITDDVATL